MKRTYKAVHLILDIHLPMITTVLITIFISYLCDREIDLLLANRYYPQMMEYVITAIFITLGSCILARSLEREHDER